ncbi:MAG: serine hydrolase [Clostridiales bacterium]|nr:serine hydrolase [Clostridiales bacterium]
MKRLILVALALVIWVNAAVAENEPEEVLAPYFCLVDAADLKTLLRGREEDVRAAPGSTTKIMTCLLTLEHCGLDTVVRVPPEALGLSKSMTRMGLQRGERYTVRELLYGLMLVSGNDAAIALAVHISGSVAEFAVLMNEKAEQLGLADTHFVNPHGLYAEEHYTTARDMAVLTAYALKNEAFREIVGTALYEIPATSRHASTFRLKNTNKLIAAAADAPLYYPHAIGVKTGSTPRGGMALVSAAEKDGVTLICVMMGLMGSDDDASYRSNRRFSDAIMLFEQEFEWRAALPAATAGNSPLSAALTSPLEEGGARPTPWTTPEEEPMEKATDRFRSVANIIFVVALTVLVCTLVWRKRG